MHQVNQGNKQPASKNDEPVVNKPESTPSHWFRAFRECLAKAQAFRLYLRLLVVPALIVGLLLVYLQTAGFPSWLIDHWRGVLGESGMVVTLDNVRLELFHGIVADRVRFYRMHSDHLPLLEAKRMVLKFDPIEWFRKRSGLRGLLVMEGALHLSPEESGPAETTGTLTMDQVHGALRIHESGLWVNSFRARFLGMDVTGRGFVALHTVETTEPRPRLDLRKVLEKFRNQLPDWATSLVEQLNTIEFTRPPHARVDFIVHPQQMEHTEISLAIEGKETRVRGILFDDWKAETILQGKKLYFPGIELSAGQSRCRFFGYLDITNRMVEATLQNNLPNEHWMNLIPNDWKAAIDNTGLYLDGPLSFELSMGPSVLDKALDSIFGKVRINRANWRGVWMEMGRCSFERDGSWIHLRDFEAELGDEDPRGHAAGWVSYNLSTSNYIGRGTFKFDPKIMVPIFNYKQRQMAQRFIFQGPPPTATFDFAGEMGNPRAFSLKGKAAMTNLIYQGSWASAFNAMIQIEGGVMSMDPLRIVRDEGEIWGKTVQYFDEKLFYVDAESTVDPKAIARMLGPKTEQFMRLYEFEGPVRLKARGTIDYGTNAQNDIAIRIDGEGIGVDRFVSDKGGLNISVTNRHVEVTGIKADIYGGQLEGEMSFDMVPGPVTNTHYRLKGQLKNVDFQELVKALRQAKGDPYTGKFFADIDVRGQIGKGRTVTGKGQVRIKDAYLYNIPLLGGLSRFLANIYKGFDFASKTEFKSNFVLRDGKAVTDDLELLGAVVSVEGKGDYYFSEDLDFDVEIQPLREGVIAEAFRVFLTPLTKLFAFHLGGTLHEPKWRPENLPKELFGKFD